MGVADELTDWPGKGNLRRIQWALRDGTVLSQGEKIFLLSCPSRRSVRARSTARREKRVRGFAEGRGKDGVRGVFACRRTAVDAGRGPICFFFYVKSAAARSGV